jgi:DNA-binding XRE family transcriptional regulator
VRRIDFAPVELLRKSKRHRKEDVASQKLAFFNGLLNRLLVRLRQLREIHGYTQESFAEKASFSYKYYQAIEAGRQRDIQLSTLERFAKAYSLEVHELLSPHWPPANLPRTRKRRR